MNQVRSIVTGLWGAPYSVSKQRHYHHRLRLKHDLHMCYKIVHSQLTIQNNDFLVFADTQVL